MGVGGSLPVVEKVRHLGFLDVPSLGTPGELGGVGASEVMEGGRKEMGERYRWVGPGFPPKEDRDPR